MFWEIGSVAKHLLLPPLLWLGLLVYGWTVLRRQPLRARWAIGTGIALLYACSTGWVSGGLMNLVLDDRPAAPGTDPQAVVILAGGRTLQFDIDGKLVQARLGASTAERVLEGVRVARERRLPMLVSGGNPDGLEPPEAVVMRDVMSTQMGIAPRWVQPKSRNTVEDAQFSGPLLKQDGITSIYLVTHRYHMRRARMLFENAGFRVVPAPVDPPSYGVFVWSRYLRGFLPTAGSLGTTYQACNEIGGLAYAWLMMRAAATPSAVVAN